VEEIGQFVAIAGNVAVGDTVLFAKYSPDTHEIEHEGKKYKVVEVSDILAVL
jgi:co-chaperonin GroES (HSP10)